MNWSKTRRRNLLIILCVACAFLLAVSITFLIVYSDIVSDDGVDPYLKVLDLDTSNLIYLDDRPSSYQVGNQYERFE